MYEVNRRFIRPFTCIYSRLGLPGKRRDRRDFGPSEHPAKLISRDTNLYRMASCVCGAELDLGSGSCGRCGRKYVRVFSDGAGPSRTAPPNPEGGGAGEEAWRPDIAPVKRPGKRKILIIVAVIASAVVVSACFLAGYIGGSPKVKIIYDGPWAGSIRGDYGEMSVSGNGSRTYDVTGGLVSAVIQKLDGTGARLTVQIVVGLFVHEEESTTEGYGLVAVSHVFGNDEG
jgi:hypothetical protein